MKTQLPGDREAIRTLAVDARAALNSMLAQLDASERAWLQTVPLDRTISAYDAYPPGWTYERQPRAVARLANEVRDLGGEVWTQRYSRFVLYELLARLPGRVPVLAIPGGQWESVERSLREVFESLADYPAVAWSDDAFVKDVAVAQLRVIPTGFSFVDRHAATARWLVALATPRQKLTVLRYLGPEFFRAADVVSNHAWRGFRAGMREPREARYLVMTELMEANPDVRYMVRSGWPVDPALTKITPHLTEQFEGMVAMGAVRYRGKASPEVTAMALQSSATRRSLHEEGKYRPVEYGLIIKRGDLLRWAERWRREQGAGPVDAARPDR